MEALLDNIRSAWNVGSMFRTADGFGLRQLYLCGITPTPESEGVGKTALGAEHTVAWSYNPNALEIAPILKAQGHRLWALEHDPRATSITESPLDKEKTVVLIVGNEIAGIDPELLNLCERILYIPMGGSKRSFNVAVAFGIAIAMLSNQAGD